ncbi:MAG: (d)CMP kinase [Solirubrobacterales bacterium]|nr:(d)CMP kinase [Solirubrobacterales bacterium]
MVIAIDGPAGAGKSSVAKALAERLDFTYLDSGAMYRCVALACLERGLDPEDATLTGELAETLEIVPGPGPVLLDGIDVSGEIRTERVTEAASRVSIHPEVRQVMVQAQRELIDTGRYVAEGRDIGTVVSPDSPLKVFLTASPEVRAERRALEAGEEAESVRRSIDQRDERDSSREHGRLEVAPDAVELDTSELGIDEVVERIAGLAAERGIT